METPESILRRLEFKVVRRLDGLLFGDYTGMFYGPSLDLAEVREYQPGDEGRRIDWNVTARMHPLFVRPYLGERELTALMLGVCPVGFPGGRRVAAIAAGTGTTARCHRGLDLRPSRAGTTGCRRSFRARPGKRATALGGHVGCASAGNLSSAGRAAAGGGGGCAAHGGG